MENDIIRQAQRNVKKKKGFYWHFGVFMACGIFFFLMNMFTMGSDPEIWFVFPLLPWSVGLTIHYFAVFGLPGTKILTDKWEAEELEKEIHRLSNKRGLEQTEELDLEDLQKQKEKATGWRDQDLV